MGSHLQEQRRAASERPKAIHSIRRARSGHWRSGTGRRLTPAQPAGAPLANAIALTGSPRPTGSPSMLPPGGGGGSSYAACRALRRRCASRPTARFDRHELGGALDSTRVAWRTRQNRKFPGPGLVWWGKPVFSPRGWLPRIWGSTYCSQTESSKCSASIAYHFSHATPVENVGQKETRQEKTRT